MIDCVILAFAVGVVGVAVGFLLGFGLRLFGVDLDALDVVFELVNRAVSILLGWSYYATYEASSRRATPGKQVAGLIVTDLNGRTLTFNVASRRYWARVLTWLTLGLGYLLVFTTKRKQTLHDLVAGTVVVIKDG